MNDFTKEELQVMLLDMECYINKTTILAESPSHKRLRDKIQSMIELYDAKVIEAWHCEKCGHVQ